MKIIKEGKDALALAFLCALFLYPFLSHTTAMRRIYPRPPHRISVSSPGHVPPKFKQMHILVTAYLISKNGEDDPNHICPSFTNKTADGDTVHYGSAAVDPRYFRFGTRFYIPGYGFAVADDTGGAVLGHHIDVAMLSCKKALQWGAKQRQVFIEV